MKTVSILDDNIGIAISWLCIAHCVALPTAKWLFPAQTATWTHSEQTHIILSGWVIFFGIAAIAKERLRHCNLNVRLLMLPGLLSVLAATVGVLVGMPEPLEIFMLSAGNLIVIVAHQLNRKLIGAHNALTCIADDHGAPVQSERYCI